MRLQRSSTHRAARCVRRTENYADGGRITTRVLLAGALALGIAAGAQAQASRYSISADGQEVTDISTALVWRRCAEGMNYSNGSCTGTPTQFSREGALARAQTEAVASAKPWRVPNVKELSTLADRSRVNPSIDVWAFPSTPSYDFLSSTPNTWSTGYTWFANFYYGTVQGGGGGLRSYSLRLVRSYVPVLSASPRIVAAGATTTLSWDTQGVSPTSCSLIGGPLPLGLPSTQLGSVSGVAVTGRLIFTLTCLGMPATATVEVIPQGGGT